MYFFSKLKMITKNHHFLRTPRMWGTVRWFLLLSDLIPSGEILTNVTLCHSLTDQRGWALSHVTQSCNSNSGTSEPTMSSSHYPSSLPAIEKNRRERSHRASPVSPRPTSVNTLRIQQAWTQPASFSTCTVSRDASRRGSGCPVSSRR